MQKKIDEMTLNENHDAEFIAKVMNVRDRVLAEKEQHSEEARKAFERAKGASKEARRRKNAELEAVRRQTKQARADRDVPLKEQVCLEQVCQTKSTLVELQRQIADLTVENTRLKVCAESSSADRDSVRVELHDALEQNYQLQNQLEEQIVKHQEQEKLNAELFLRLLEEKEKLTVREQENFMLEHRVEELSGEVERTRMLHLERVVTCVSGASKDKNAPQRFAGEYNSQILTETQQEFKMDLPTDHAITDVTENTGNMWKSLQEYGNTEFDDAFIATQEGLPENPEFWGHVLRVRWKNLTTRRTNVKARLKKKVWSSAQRWLTCGVQPWTTRTSLQPRAMILTKSSTSMTKIGTTTGTLWMWLQMIYSQQLCLKETRGVT